jgi:hypothetical protein
VNAKDNRATIVVQRLLTSEPEPPSWKDNTVRLIDPTMVQTVATTTVLGLVYFATMDVTALPTGLNQYTCSSLSNDPDYIGKYRICIFTFLYINQDSRSSSFPCTCILILMEVWYPRSDLRSRPYELSISAVPAFNNTSLRNHLLYAHYPQR